MGDIYGGIRLGTNFTFERRQGKRWQKGGWESPPSEKWARPGSVSGCHLPSFSMVGRDRGTGFVPRLLLEKRSGIFPGGASRGAESAEKKIDRPCPQGFFRGGRGCRQGAGFFGRAGQQKVVLSRPF